MAHPRGGPGGGTSLSRQLSTHRQAHQGASSTPLDSAQRPTLLHPKTFLHPTRIADDARSAWARLAARFPALEGFSEVFSSTRASDPLKERHMLSQQEVDANDEDCKELLRLLSPILAREEAGSDDARTDALYVLELLVSRYRVHTCLGEDLILALLPSHETKLFVDVVNLPGLVLLATKWRFLHGLLRKHADPLARQVLIKYMCLGADQVLETTLEYHRVINTEFWAAILVETLEYASAHEPSHLASATSVSLRHVSKALKTTEDPKRFVAGLHAASSVASVAPLSLETLKALMTVLGKRLETAASASKSEDLLSQLASCMMMVFQTQINGFSEEEVTSWLEDPSGFAQRLTRSEASLDVLCRVERAHGVESELVTRLCLLSNDALCRAELSPDRLARVVQRTLSLRDEEEARARMTLLSSRSSHTLERLLTQAGAETKGWTQVEKRRLEEWTRMTTTTRAPSSSGGAPTKSTEEEETIPETTRAWTSDDAQICSTKLLMSDARSRFSAMRSLKTCRSEDLDGDARDALVSAVSAALAVWSDSKDVKLDLLTSCARLGFVSEDIKSAAVETGCVAALETTFRATRTLQFAWSESERDAFRLASTEATREMAEKLAPEWFHETSALSATTSVARLETLASEARAPLVGMSLLERRALSLSSGKSKKTKKSSGEEEDGVAAAADAWMRLSALRSEEEMRVEVSSEVLESVLSRLSSPETSLLHLLRVSTRLDPAVAKPLLARVPSVELALSSFRDASANALHALRVRLTKATTSSKETSRLLGRLMALVGFSTSPALSNDALECLCLMKTSEKEGTRWLEWIRKHRLAISRDARLVFSLFKSPENESLRETARSGLASCEKSEDLYGALAWATCLEDGFVTAARRAVEDGEVFRLCAEEWLRSDKRVAALSSSTSVTELASLVLTTSKASRLEELFNCASGATQRSFWITGDAVMLESDAVWTSQIFVEALTMGRIRFPIELVEKFLGSSRERMTPARFERVLWLIRSTCEHPARESELSSTRVKSLLETTLRGTETVFSNTEEEASNVLTVQALNALSALFRRATSEVLPLESLARSVWSTKPSSLLSKVLTRQTSASIGFSSAVQCLETVSRHVLEHAASESEARREMTAYWLTLLTTRPQEETMKWLDKFIRLGFELNPASVTRLSRHLARATTETPTRFLLFLSERAWTSEAGMELFLISMRVMISELEDAESDFLERVGAVVLSSMSAAQQMRVCVGLLFMNVEEDEEEEEEDDETFLRSMERRTRFVSRWLRSKSFRVAVLRAEEEAGTELSSHYLSLIRGVIECHQLVSSSSAEMTQDLLDALDAIVALLSVPMFVLIANDLLLSEDHEEEEEEEEDEDGLSASSLTVRIVSRFLATSFFVEDVAGLPQETSLLLTLFTSLCHKLETKRASSQTNQHATLLAIDALGEALLMVREHTKRLQIDKAFSVGLVTVLGVLEAAAKEKRTHVQSSALLCCSTLLRGVETTKILLKATHVLIPMCLSVLSREEEVSSSRGSDAGLLRQSSLIALCALIATKSAVPSPYLKELILLSTRLSGVSASSTPTEEEEEEDEETNLMRVMVESIPSRLLLDESCALLKSSRTDDVLPLILSTLRFWNQTLMSTETPVDRLTGLIVEILHGLFRLPDETSDLSTIASVAVECALSLSEREFQTALIAIQTRAEEASRVVTGVWIACVSAWTRSELGGVFVSLFPWRVTLEYLSESEPSNRTTTSKRVKRDAEVSSASSHWLAALELLRAHYDAADSFRLTSPSMESEDAIEAVASFLTSRAPGRVAESTVEPLSELGLAVTLHAHRFFPTQFRRFLRVFHRQWSRDAENTLVRLCAMTTLRKILSSSEFRKSRDVVQSVVPELVTCLSERLEDDDELVVEQANLTALALQDASGQNVNELLRD